MAADDQLVASIKDAEKEAQSDDLESLFLVQLVTAATLDKNPTHSLREIYEALVEAKPSLLLDPLNLLPLLVPSDEDGASDMLQTIAREGNAKEAIIGVQESLERLEKSVKEDESGQAYVVQLTRLLAICGESVPRLRLRRRGPLETLRPLLTHLGAAVETVAPLARGDDGRNILSSVSNFVQAALPWITQNGETDDPTHQNAFGLLSNLLFVAVEACATHIRTSLAQRRFETYYSRLVLHPVHRPDTQSGEEAMQEALVAVKALGVTPEAFASHPFSFGKLILFAHQQPSTFPTSQESLQKLIPVLTSSLQENVAMDESLAILLTFLSTTFQQLSQETVEPLFTLITPLAATHPHPPTRHIAFRILAALLSRAPPPIHLAHLSSLLTECPFPQMRVAAVGLVKEAFLNAVTSSGTEPSPFKSTTLVRALGPVLFRPDPPDLFVSPSAQSLRKFLESSEPARLTECLAFYYVLLKRDTANMSGIHDQDMLRTVENGLLAPIRKGLATWLELEKSSSMGGDPDLHALMPLASLETSLERVDAAVASLTFE